MRPCAFSFASFARSTVPALLISMTAGAWCWWATGTGLGLFLGMVLLAACYIPPLVLAENGRASLVALGGAVFGVGIVWLAATNWADVTVLEWLKCLLVFAAFAWAVAGMAWLLAGSSGGHWGGSSFARPLATGATLVAALLWLAWPVWLSPSLTQPMVNWLVPAHPVFAINAVLQHLGTWDRAPLAYNQLTVLNQDVAYRLPPSIWPAVVLHLLIGVPGWWLCLSYSIGDARCGCTAAPVDPGTR